MGRAPFLSEFPEFVSTFSWARRVTRAPMALIEHRVEQYQSVDHSRRDDSGRAEERVASIQSNSMFCEQQHASIVCSNVNASSLAVARCRRESAHNPDGMLGGNANAL